MPRRVDTVGSTREHRRRGRPDRERTVLLRADARTPWQAVVTAYDALGQLGFKRIANATAPQVRQAPGAR